MRLVVRFLRAVEIGVLILDLLTNNLPIHGIDVNSKFENEDTLKDIGKLKEFKKILRL